MGIKVCTCTYTCLLCTFINECVQKVERIFPFQDVICESDDDCIARVSPCLVAPCPYHHECVPSLQYLPRDCLGYVDELSQENRSV